MKCTNRVEVGGWSGFHPEPFLLALEYMLRQGGLVHPVRCATGAKQGRADRTMAGRIIILVGGRACCCAVAWRGGVRRVTLGRQSQAEAAHAACGTALFVVGQVTDLAEQTSGSAVGRGTDPAEMKVCRPHPAAAGLGAVERGGSTARLSPGGGDGASRSTRRSAGTPAPRCPAPGAPSYRGRSWWVNPQPLVEPPSSVRPQPACGRLRRMT